MNMKKILSMLMAVAMVLSMVVVPVAAEGEENPYTITLSGPNGESSVTAEPGTTVDIYMTSSGDCVPGWTATGGWVTYPEGWTIKTTNKFSLAMMLDGVDSPMFNNNDDINPAMVAWACSGTTHGGTTDWSLLTLTGQMAILTFTIPEDAQPGTYDLTIANGEGRDKTNFASIADENGVITDFLHADDLAVNFVGCSVVVEESVEEDACPIHGSLGWTDATETLWGAGGAITSGHYKLTENITPSAALTVAADQEVCIDLAGFNITMPVTKGIRAFEIAAGGTLTVIDSAETDGVISGGRFGNLSTASTSTSADWAKGGNIYNEGTFNLYGGTINNGKAYSGSVYCAAMGGNYYGAAGSVLNMYGGTVDGGEAYTTSYVSTATRTVGGGNIYSLGTVNISGGTVSGGKVIEDYVATNAGRSVYFWGGNILIWEGGALNISGGTITGGQVEAARTNSSTYGAAVQAYGGNIAAKTATLTISGGTISGGSVKAIVSTSGTSSKEFCSDVYSFGGNLYASGSTVTITGGDISGGTATLQIKNNGDTTKDGNTDICARGGNVYFAATTAAISGGTITGGALSRVDDETITTDDYGTCYGGNLTVNSTSTVTVSGTTNFSGGTATHGGTIYNVGTMDMTGGQIGTPAVTDEEGNVTTAAVVGSATYGGSIYNGGTLTVSGGLIYGGTATTQGGNIYNSSSLTISGGTINAGEAADGGNIYLYNGATMTGGTVSDGTCGDRSITTCKSGYRGGNIFLPSGETFTMSGGTISGGWALYRGGGIWVAGTAKISGNALITENAIPYDGGSWGGNICVTGTLKLYDQATITKGRAERGGNIHTSPSMGKIYMYGGYVYDGDASDGNNDIRIGTGTSNAFYMYGGYVDHVATQGASLMYFYNGVLGTDISSRAVNIGACSHANALGGYYNIWHADGTCATCGHSYGAYDAAEVVCATCETSHETLGGAHTFVEGVCACGYALPAHEAACAHGCENVEWVPFDGVTVEEGGHYYLTDNMALAATVTVSVKACIDTNGFTLTAPPAARAFLANEGGELTLMDSSADNTGVLRGFSLAAPMFGGNLRVNSDSALYLYDLTVTGGIIDGSTDGNRGGNIYVYGTGAYLEINNAKVTNGTSLDAGNNLRGGNICTYLRGTVVIKGEDTKITGGTVYGTSRNCYGGNLYAGQGAALYIYDGEISGGKAKGGANICWMNGKESADQYGHIYMYGGTVGAPAEDCAEVSVLVYGTSAYQNEFYMFGGEIHSIDFSEDVGYGVKGAIYNGVLGTNPATLSVNGSMVADCAVVSYDEETKLYTVSHINTAETCNSCSGDDAGCINGYSESHIYEYVVTGIVAKAGDTAYTELPTALDAAAHTELTVILMDNVSVDGNVDIYCALDLNGYALTASGVVDAANEDGHIVDSVGTGTATGSDMLLYETNGMLAIDAANNGVHSYEKVDIVQKVADIEDAEGNAVEGQKSVKFYIDKAESATKLDDAIKAGSDVEIRITVKWGDNKSHSFTYTDDLVQKYLADWNNKIFTCTIVGLEDLGEYSIHADVKSDGVVVEAYDYTPEA